MYTRFPQFGFDWTDHVSFVTLISLYLTALFVFGYLIKWKQLSNFARSSDTSNSTALSCLFPRRAQLQCTSGQIILFTCFYGLCREAYRYGVQLVYFAIPYSLANVVLFEIYLRITWQRSVFTLGQYMESRFNRGVSILVTLFQSIHQFLQLSLALCVPSVVFSQGTGYPMWLAVIIFGVLSATYNRISVLQRMTMTNVVQLLLVFTAVACILGIGVQRVGGPVTLIHQLEQAQLLRFNSFIGTRDENYTFVSIVVGGLFMLLSYLAVSPTEIERNGLSTSQSAVRSGNIINTILCASIIVGMAWIGLVCFAYLNWCDLTKAGLIANEDMLLPFVMFRIFDNVKTVRGTLAGVLSIISLSSMATYTRSLASICMHDLFRVAAQPGMVTKVHWLNRHPGVTAVISNLLAIPVAYGFVSSSASLLKLSLCAASIFGGPVFVVLGLAIFLPFMNSMGAFAALIFGPLTGSGLLVATFRENSYRREFIPSAKAMLNCTSFVMPGRACEVRNLTYSTSDLSSSRPTAFQMSYLYIGAICCSVSLVTALLTSGVAQFVEYVKSDRHHGTQIRRSYDQSDVTSRIRNGR